MTDLQFEKFKSLIYSEFGNTVTDDRRFTLESKVEKIIKRYHEGRYTAEEYYKKLMKDGKNSDTWTHFVDEITVHKTNFYRENVHFEYIRKNIQKIIEEVPTIKARREIRVWCAAASSGEEPYSIAMMLREIMPPNYSIKFLATDISEKVLKVAVAGKYPEVISNDVPKELLDKYFIKDDGGYVACDELKKIITFRRFNLCDPFKFKHKFDIVFCRNVMIYFDDELRTKILNKFYDNMSDNSLLIIGLSESIGTKNQDFKSIGSSMYRK